MTTAEPLEPMEDPHRSRAHAPAALVTGEVLALARSVGEVRRAITGLIEEYGVSEAMVGKVRLAVSEAVTNVVRHAYANRRFPGWLRYDADIEDGDLEIVIADDGDGFRGDADDDALGLGLHVIATVADDFAITTRHGGIEVWMRFILDQRESA